MSRRKKGRRGQWNKPKNGQDPKSKSQHAKLSPEEETSAGPQPGPSGQQQSRGGREPPGQQVAQPPLSQTGTPSGQSPRPYQAAFPPQGTDITSPRPYQPAFQYQGTPLGQSPRPYQAAFPPQGTDITSPRPYQPAFQYQGTPSGQSPRPYQAAFPLQARIPHKSRTAMPRAFSHARIPPNQPPRTFAISQTLIGLQAETPTSVQPQTPIGATWFWQQPLLPEAKPSPDTGIPPYQPPRAFAISQTSTSVQPQTPIGATRIVQQFWPPLATLPYTVIQPGQPPSAHTISETPTSLQAQTPTSVHLQAPITGRQMHPQLASSQQALAAGSQQPQIIDSQQPHDTGSRQPHATRSQQVLAIGSQRPQFVDSQQTQDRGSQQLQDIGSEQPQATSSQQALAIGSRQPQGSGSQQPQDRGSQQLEDTDSKQFQATGSQQPRDIGSQQPQDIGSEEPQATSSQQLIATGSQQPQDRGSQQPEDTDSQQLQATGSQQPQTTRSQEPEATGSKQPQKTMTEEDEKILQTLLTLPLRRNNKVYKKEMRVIVNYFPLNTAELETAFHYEVTIVPDKPKRIYRQIMEEVRKKLYSNQNPAYDGNKNLYSSKPLLKKSEVCQTILIFLENGSTNYDVTLKLISQLDLTCFRDAETYAKHTSILYTKIPAPLQCLNVILSNIPTADRYRRIGRSYFATPDVHFKLGDSCVLHDGFSQAAVVRWKPFVNLDVAYKGITESKSLLDLIKEMFPKAKLNEELKDYETARFSNYIRGLQIMYQLGHTRRKFIVNDVYSSARKAVFDPAAKNTVTVETYFRDEKRIPLKYPNLPTLLVGEPSKLKKIWLPLEFCTLVDDQPVSRMTDNQVRNMIKEVCKTTTHRLAKIQSSVTKLEYDNNKTMKEFKLTVDTNPQEVRARILQSPNLQYNTSQRTVSRGVWTPDKFRQGANISCWTIFCLDERTTDRKLLELSRQLQLNAVELGLVLAQPKPPYIRGRSTAELNRHLNEHKVDYELLVVILNYQNDCYNEVKRISELLTGYVTQCIKPKSIQPIKKATICNILLKINAKRNGQSHQLCYLPESIRENTMMMGADVTHPGTSNFPSVAAVTASYDGAFLKYRFEWRLQKPRQELITDLKEITKQHLAYYCEKNCHQRPTRLFYIRDGVSDGQFIEVLKVELQAIRAACTEVDSNYQPAIVFIIVQKRHRTRFFPKDLSMSEDSNNNVPTGTCIDTIITHPSIVDFYLVSHASIRGVARPTKYVKLWSDIDISEEELELIMYYLCHLYVRCNRSVSYPAPTYYAHHAAARAKAYCDRNIDTSKLDEIQKSLQIRENILNNYPMFFI